MSRSAPYVVQAVSCGHRWLENRKPGRRHTHCWKCGERGHGPAFWSGITPQLDSDAFRVQEDLLLHNLHLWLHRAGGDEDLATACRLAQRLPAALTWLDERPTAPEAMALITLERWFRGHRVDLIGDAEDFHEAMDADCCQHMDELTVQRDGRVALGREHDYELPDVVPLVRVKR